MTTGEKIRAAREAAHLTQAALAEQLGVTQGLISQWETDHRGSTPTVATLRALGEALGVEWHTLAGE